MRVGNSADLTAVLYRSDDILSQLYRSADRGRRRRYRAAARPFQHDEGRLAEPIAAIDALARGAAIHRHRHHDVHRLGDGEVGGFLARRYPVVFRVTMHWSLRPALKDVQQRSFREHPSERPRHRKRCRGQHLRMTLWLQHS